MHRLLARYDAYLRRQAEAARPIERIRVVRSAFLPWIGLIALAAFATELVNLDPRVELAAFGLVGLIALAAGTYATSRVTSHGWRFDRTPPPQPWLDTENGRLLLSQLQRVSLSGLSNVTLTTEIYGDLDIWGAELRDLLAGLARACSVPALPLPPGPYAPEHRGAWQGWARGRRPRGGYASLTVGMLLEAMARTRGRLT